LSMWPHSAQVREVYTGSTYTSGTPARRALYPMKLPSWAKAQLEWVARWGLRSRTRSRMPVRSFRAILPGAFCLGHHMLGDLVVDVLGPPRLLAPALLQAAFRGRGVLLLQFGRELALADPDPVDLAPCHDLAVGRGGDVHDAQRHRSRAQVTEPEKRFGGCAASSAQWPDR
jgi:hypothetical protein